MKGKILVTHAIITGSSNKVSEATGKTLSESGADGDVISMKHMKSISQYKAVIL
jgi:menaquinone-dependent protoporphyrinogen IX oxidase